MLPRHPHNVNRNFGNQPSNPQPFADHRAHSTPQPIPRNPALNSLQRGAPGVRNFHANSPTQSPRQYAPSPSRFPGTGMMAQNEMNQSYSSAISQSPAKSQTNGSFGWQSRPMYGSHTHPNQVQSHNTYQTANPMAPKPLRQPTSSYNYDQNAPMVQSLSYFPRQTGPPHRPPSHPSANQFSVPAASAHTSMHAQGPPATYFSQPPPQQQQPTPYYPNQMSIPAPSYAAGGAYDQSMYQNQPAVHMPTQSAPPMSMPQQQPQQAQSRTKVVIKDPKTMRDVTNDILQKPGSQSETSSVSSQSPSTSSVSLSPAVQFAAQVAAAAGGNPGPSSSNHPPPMVPSPGDMAHSPMHYPSRQQHAMKPASPATVPVLPSNVDVSKPPPSLPNIPHFPAGTSPLHTPQTLPLMQALPHQYVQGPGLGSSPKTMQNTPRLNPNTRPDAPVAIVQPLLPVTNQNKVGEIKAVVTTVKPDARTNQKIEEILSTAEAIRLEHDKSEHLLQDIVSNQQVKVEKANEAELPAQKELPVPAQEELAEEDKARTDNVTEVKNDADVAQIEIAPSVSIAKNQNDVTTTEITEIIDDKKMEPGLTSPDNQDTMTSCDLIVTSESLDSAPPAAVDPQVLEERGDVSAPEGLKTDLDANEKTSIPLSSGDSAVNEPVDKVFPKTPEEEMVAEQEQELDTNKAVSEIVSQASVIIKSRDDVIIQEEKSEQGVSETPEITEVDAVPEEQPFSDSGKKVYGREFLLQFRFHSSAMEKPIDLPPIDEIIMDRPPPKSSVSSAPPSYYRDGPDFAPSWMRQGGQRGGRQSSRGLRPGPPRQGYQGGYGGQMNPPKVITKSIQKEPELNKAENAWKPSKLESKPVGSVASEEEQTEEILKTVRSILNKLTPQKFTPLMQKFRQLPINTENRLREVINLVFEKAIDEPNFSEAYANMCRTMSQFKLMVPGAASQGGAPTGTVEFRKVLLTRCQREFEKDRTAEDKLSDLRKKVEEEKNPELKQQYKEDLEYAESKDRRHMLGNIRFIGELFKLSMLTETIMHNCVMALFKRRDDESLESLCRLLTTIGKDLDHVKGKQRMDQYFQQIDKIIKERKTSSRVRFMLKDVVDLRLNTWVPRAIKAQGPKTIDQIHQDAKEEKEQKAAAVAAAAAAAPVKNQSRGGRMGSRGSNPHGNQDEGWTKVQKPMRIDPQKMKFSSKTQFDESNVTLGPTRGKLGWKSGSGSSATRTGSSGSGGYSGRDALDGIAPRSSTPTTMNRFSALGGPGNPDYSQRGYGKVSSQERTKNDSRGSSGSARGAGREEKQSAVDVVRRWTSSEKKQAAVGTETPPSKPSLNAPEAKVDVAVVAKKVEAIIQEYLCIYDVKEAGECFEELKLPSSSQHLIVKTCLESTLEKSSGDRDLVAKLLATLVKNGKIFPDQYIKGVTNNMELAIDVEIDLPKVWACLAEQIGSIFTESGGKIALHSLKEMTRPLMQAKKAHLFVAEVLKKLIRHMNIDSAVQYWKLSNLSLDFFMKSATPSEIMEFAEKQGLEDFYNLSEQGEKPIQSQFDRYLSNISKQLSLHKENEPVVHWIEENISPDEKLGSDFIRALTTAVCDSAINQGNQNIELDKNVLSLRSLLLKRYINDSMELQALYALQRLYVSWEQPPNILKPFFYLLYDEDVISEQTFWKWKEEENPEELEGKGVAILSATSFFTWLQQAEADSDE